MTRPREEWRLDVSARYRALEQFSKEDARLQFLRILRSLPYGVRRGRQQLNASAHISSPSSSNSSRGTQHSGSKQEKCGCGRRWSAAAAAAAAGCQQNA